MADPALPTNINSGGTTTGHKAHSDTVHGIVNKLDTTITPTSAHTLVGDGTRFQSRALLSTDIPTAARNAQTGTTYTAVAGDAGKLIEMNNASLNTVTLPSLPAGTTLGIMQYGDGLTVIVPSSGVTIRSRDGFSTLSGKYAFASVYYRTSTEAMLGGDLQSVSPTDVATLGLWFKAADLSLLSDGTQINGNWTAAFGTSTASQATSGFRPTKQTVNGKPVVRFDGVDDRLTLSGDALTITQNKSALTIFARYRLYSINATTVSGIAGFSVGTGTNGRSVLRANGGNWQMLGRRNDADASSSVGTTAYEFTSEHTLCGVFDYTNTDANLFLDGAAAGSNTTWLTTGSTENTASVSAVFGAGPNSADFAELDLKEVLVYTSALNASGRQHVEAYLAAA